MPVTQTVQGGFTYFRITMGVIALTSIPSFIMTINHKDKNAVLEFHEAYIKEIE